MKLPRKLQHLWASSLSSGWHYIAENKNNIVILNVIPMPEAINTSDIVFLFLQLLKT